MTIVEQVAQYLDDQAIGIIGSSLFFSYLPETDSGDFTIAVIDTGGFKPSIYIPTKSPNFQVFIRAKDFDTGKAKLDAIRLALHQKMNSQLVTGQTYFYYIFAQAEGGHLGKNESGKDEFSINFYAKTR